MAMFSSYVRLPGRVCGLMMFDGNIVSTCLWNHHGKIPTKNRIDHPKTLQEEGMESEVPDVLATNMKEQLVEKSLVPGAAGCGRLRPSIHLHIYIYVIIYVYICISIYT